MLSVQMYSKKNIQKSEQSPHERCIITQTELKFLVYAPEVHFRAHPFFFDFTTSIRDQRQKQDIEMFPD